MTSHTLCTVERALRAAAAAGPVLGIDTGGPQADLAVVTDGRVVAESSLSVARHGTELPQAVSDLLRRVQIRISDLKAIAVGIGPGSFTGLRVGLSYAKGIAMATRCALIGVNSLDSLALAALTEAPRPVGSSICVVLDARKGEVYAALYRIGVDGLEKLIDDLVVTLENLAPHIGTDVLLVGDKKAEEALSLIAGMPGQAQLLGVERLRLRGRVVAALGAAWFMAGEIDNAVTLQPLYVRPAEATFNSGSPNSGSDGKWSGRKKNSSFNTQPTTKN
jgi:tRNA threonylcarbamoyladenosine biosynthesis protein TsaB